MTPAPASEWLLRLEPRIGLKHVPKQSHTAADVLLIEKMDEFISVLYPHTRRNHFSSLCFFTGLNHIL